MIFANYAYVNELGTRVGDLAPVNALRPMSYTLLADQMISICRASA